LVDPGDHRGNPVRTLEVTDPNVKAKKMVAWAIPLSTVVMVSVLAFLALIYTDGDPFFQTLYILVMILFGASEIMVFLFYQSLFGKSWHKVVFYDNGIQFPKYMWDRMRGRGSFLAKDRIVSVRASFITDPRMVGSNTAELIFGSVDGKLYRTGYRTISDINSFSIWLGTEWQMKVERTDLRGNPIASPHKVRVVARPETRTCLGCGYSFTDDLGFCPSCGRMISEGMDPLDPFAPQRTAKEPLSLIHSPPAQYEQPGASGDYPRPGQDPPYPTWNQYGRQDVPAPLSPGDGFGPYPLAQPTNLRGKSPRLAMILAGVPGLLGVMGIGHIYMGKYLKGFILLILGGFLALLSLASIILVFMPDEFSLGAKVVTAAIMSAPFLGLFLWQLFDAPKPTSSRPVQDPNGYLRPPYGP
jgi:TM2 domain-containing membrane protein YozV